MSILNCYSKPCTAITARAAVQGRQPRLEELCFGAGLALTLNVCSSVYGPAPCTAPTAMAPFSGRGQTPLPSLAMCTRTYSPYPKLQCLNLLVSPELLKRLIQPVHPQLRRRWVAEVRALQAMPVVPVELPQGKGVVPCGHHRNARLAHHLIRQLQGTRVRFMFQRAAFSEVPSGPVCCTAESVVRVSTFITQATRGFYKAPHAILYSAAA